jgi:hypothetical protein
MDARHHHAHAPGAVIILVPEAGSPKSARTVKPRYPSQTPREHWDGPPRRINKAEKLARLIDALRRQDQMVREMMRPDCPLSAPLRQRTVSAKRGSLDHRSRKERR